MDAPAESPVPSTIGTAQQKQQKKELTADELTAVWQQDEFWGKGGTYECDLYTGKRTRVGD